MPSSSISDQESINLTCWCRCWSRWIWLESPMFVLCLCTGETRDKDGAFQINSICKQSLRYRTRYTTPTDACNACCRNMSAAHDHKVVLLLLRDFRSGSDLHFHSSAHSVASIRHTTLTFHLCSAINLTRSGVNRVGCHDDRRTPPPLRALPSLYRTSQRLFWMCSCKANSLLPTLKNIGS